MGMGIAAGAMGVGSLMSGIGNVSNGHFNSKIELKTWALEFATYHKLNLSDVMALFQYEYNALPLTPNESLSKEFQKSLDSIKDMISDIMAMVAEAKANGTPAEDIKEDAMDMVKSKME